MSSNAPASPSTGDGKAAAILVGVVLAVLSLPAAAVAAAAWKLGLRRLGRIEGALIAGVGVLGIALDGVDHLVAYGAWWPGLLWGASPWWQPPLLSLLLVAAVFLGVILLIQGTAIAGRVPNPLRKKTSPLDVEAVVPDADTREATKIAAPPGGLLPDIEDHSLMSRREGGRRIPIGVDPKGAPVYVTEDELGYPSVVFGSTGSGKTVYLMTLIAALLDLGWDGIVIDQKEDTKPGGLRDFLVNYAATHTLPYQELRLSDPDPDHWFNPFRGMGADEAADTVLTLAPADDFFWGALSNQLCRQGLTLLYDAHTVDPTKYPFPSPFELARLFKEGPAMAARSKEMRADVLTKLGASRAKEDYSSISNPSADEAKNAPGFAAKLMTIYQSAAGRACLRPGANSAGVPKQEVDVTRGGITYIGLDSLGKPELTQVISAAVLQRMNVEASKRTTGSASIRPCFLIIDEANTVNRKILQNMVSRVRSARISLILATQGPLDWDVAQASGKGHGVAGFNALAQNINLAIIMSQGEPESAQVCADFIGTREVFQTSSRITADGLVDATARKDVDYYVPPQQLRELEVGEAIIKVRIPKHRVQYARVTMRDASQQLRRPR